MWCSCRSSFLFLAFMTNEEHTDNAQGATRDAETQAAEAKVEKMFEYGYRKSNYGPDELVTDAIAAVETSKLIESESTIESLIQAQGYSNCIVYLDGDSAKVVVQTEGLDAAQAAAIKDVILGEVSVPAENIRIFEVK